MNATFRHDLTINQSSGCKESSACVTCMKGFACFHCRVRKGYLNAYESVSHFRNPTPQISCISLLSWCFHRKSRKFLPSVPWISREPAEFELPTHHAAWITRRLFLHTDLTGCGNVGSPNSKASPQSGGQNGKFQLEVRKSHSHPKELNLERVFGRHFCDIYTQRFDALFPGDLAQELGNGNELGGNYIGWNEYC